MMGEKGQSDANIEVGNEAKIEKEKTELIEKLWTGIVGEIGNQENLFETSRKNSEIRTEVIYDAKEELLGYSGFALSGLDLSELSRRYAALVQAEERDVPPFTGIKVFDLTTLVFTFAPEEQIEAEESAETITLDFTGKCSFCQKEHVVRATVPVSSAGKIKKDKKSGQKYRDWDYGEVPCTCEQHGRPTKVVVYYREWLEPAS